MPHSRPFLHRLLLASCVALAAAASAVAEPMLRVEPARDGGGVTVRVRPADRFGKGVLELIDPADGTVLRTLHGGVLPRDAGFRLAADDQLPPGRYRLRYREGLSLVVAERLPEPGPDGRRWVNPVEIVFRNGSIYVLEAPLPREEGPVEGHVQTAHIYKLDRDGRPDEGFADRGRLTLPHDRYYPLRSFAVDEQGQVYIASTYHEVLVHDAQGKRLPHRIGGWDNDPRGPQCTGWLNSLWLGPDHRIYLPTGFGNMRVYDRTKNGFEGLLYSTDLPGGRGLDRAVAADGNGAVYVIGSDNTIVRFDDDGSALSLRHVTRPPIGVAKLTAPWPSAGLLWVSDRGPSPGPFWDSGGGGQLLLLWDDGQQCRLVDRFGRIGTAEDRPEFVDPSGLVMTADHLELWVVEDGHRYPEGPSGNARIRRFRIEAKHAEEVEVDLPAPTAATAEAAR